MAPGDTTVDAYVKNCPPAVIPLLEKLRAFALHSLPGASEGMQYGAPIILNAHGAPVIYLYGAKRHVNFGFLRSAEMSDPDGVLQGSGKPSKHIKLYPDRPIDEALLLRLVTQCGDLKPVP